MKALVDWEEIERQYLSSDMTMEELGKKYGVSERTIQRKSVANGWVVKKETLRGTNQVPVPITPGAKLKLDEHLDELIDNVVSDLPTTNWKSREGAVSCLIKLFELEIKRKPRSIEDVADLCIQLGFSVEDFISVLSAKWSVSLPEGGEND